MPKELTPEQKQAVVDALNEHDVRTAEAFASGNMDFVPDITDSLDFEDMKLDIEVALDLPMDTSFGWQNLKRGATLQQIFEASAHE